ncbi:DNA N-6-adenine-methyltransferase [Pannus brasiliensis CCIBt3594]|uniref:DNA N-6-adenine-methyltransferase n=1 Tax=Pannus brasiliensis CCIBt3594 TaxID=1427578 RepID=A0AAW9QL65_9CHRO
MTTQLSLFDYQDLDVETRIVVRQRTDEIKTLMRRSAQDIIDIGGKLNEVKDRLEHGQFGDWLKAEFQWTDRTARNFMNVHTRFKSENISELKIGATALYALASPSLPDEARAEAIERAKTESIGEKEVKAIAEKYEWKPGDRAKILTGKLKDQFAAVITLGNKYIITELESDGTQKGFARSDLEKPSLEEESYAPHGLKLWDKVWLDGEECQYFYPIGLNHSIVYFHSKKERNGRISHTHRVPNSEINIQLDFTQCPTNSTNLTSTAGTDADSPSPESSPNGSNSDSPPTTTQTVKQSSDFDTPTRKSPETFTSSDGKTTTSEIPAEHGSESTSLQPPLPANPSASKETEKELMTPATESPDCSPSSKPSSPDISLSRTSPDCSPVPSNPETNPEVTSESSSKALRSSGLMLNGCVSEVGLLEAPFSGNDYYWLPSPGALSAPDGKKSPGQSRLEAHLKDIGILASNEVLNPLYLEKSFSLPLNWTNPLESRPATQLLNSVDRPWGIALIGESLSAPSIESSGFTTTTESDFHWFINDNDETFFVHVGDLVKDEKNPGMCGRVLEIDEENEAVFVEWKKEDEEWSEDPLISDQNSYWASVFNLSFELYLPTTTTESDFQVGNRVRVPTIPGMLGKILDFNQNFAFVEWSKGEKTWIAIDGLETLEDDPFNGESPSKSAEHYTPKEVLDLVLEVLGEIGLDPCSNLGKNVPANRHYTKEDDGLHKNWEAETLFMNPPYGREIGEWVEKLVWAYEVGRVKEAIALVPAKTDTKWFSRFYGYYVCFWRGRITFVNNEDPAQFPNAVFYLGDDPEKFIKVFRRKGDIYKGA